MPRPSSLRNDAIAGVSVAIANVPDGMANGLLVGVNPIHGLYATMIGPFVGGLATSSQLMVISTTAAASLTAAQSLAGASADDRASALFLLVMLSGVFQLILGLLGVGRLARFVSYSVLTGFLAGVSVLLILSQIPTVTGYRPHGSNRVTQTIDVAAHAGSIHPTTVAIAALTLVLSVLLARTRLGALGRPIAIAIPSLIVVLAHLDGVRLVRDLGAIPRSVPLPALPALNAWGPAVLTGALSLALVILVQGVGVSQNVPNPTGSSASIRRDILAQGASNVASGLFRGLPVGGSLSTTALGVISGSRSRWSSVIAGLAMALIVVSMPRLVGLVAMPSLGALLVLAGLAGLHPRELLAVGRTGWPSLLGAATTFLSTLFLPIQAAVGIGVVLSALLHVGTSSADITIVELKEQEDGSVVELSPPRRLESNRVTTLDVYGHLFYAGARTLEQMLPAADDATRAVVILRLRGRNALGATLIDVLAHYADALQLGGGRLYLTGVSAHVHEQLVRTGKMRLSGPVRVFEATPVLGESSRRARSHAEAWLIRRDENSDTARSEHVPADD